jgi:hypothetical protein
MVLEQASGGGEGGGGVVSTVVTYVDVDYNVARVYSRTIITIFFFEMFGYESWEVRCLGRGCAIITPVEASGPIGAVYAVHGKSDGKHSLSNG